MPINNYEQMARDVLKAGDVATGKDGRLYLDGTMTRLIAAQALAEAIYVGEIFRDGQSVSMKYVTNAKAGDIVRVPLETPYPNSSRTLKIGARDGSKDNGGIINKNAPLMPADSEFLVYLNQVNDQPLLFPEMSMEWMPFNTVAKRTAGYAKTVVEDRSASTLAEIIAYNVYRSMNEGKNIQKIDMTKEGAFGDLLNDLHTALSDGDRITGAHTYSTEGRTIIARPSFINKMFNRKSGVILTGSDLAQTMLKDYAFDKNISEREYVGNSFKGYAMGFAFQEAANFIWERAEGYLGLQKGALDHVLAIAVSSEATAASNNIDLGFKIIDANEVRGLKGQPLNCWGAEGFRKIQIIGDDTLSNDVFKSAGFSENERKRPCAPGDVEENMVKISKPIYNINGDVVGYETISAVPRPNGGNIQAGTTRCTIAVFDESDQAVSDATVTVSAPTGITVKNNRDGTYTFSVPQGSAVTASVVKSGKKTASVTIAKTKTAEALCSHVVKMEAQD